MRQLLCEACGQKQKLRDGERVALPANWQLDPAEHERVVWGTAGAPTAAQRTLWVNNVPVPMGVSEFNCDSCNAPIKPGERCCAWSVWIADRPEPPWEMEYITPDKQG